MGTNTNELTTRFGIHTNADALVSAVYRKGSTPPPSPPSYPTPTGRHSASLASPLSLIPPQFEAPLPPLKPALFAPTMCEPPPPPLELFDLDEDFASDKVQRPNCHHVAHTPFRPYVTNGCSFFLFEKVRLAHLANRCTDGDLEELICEASEVLGVRHALPPEERGARHVLTHVFTQIVQWKKFDGEDAARGGELEAPGPRNH